MDHGETVEAFSESQAWNDVPVDQSRPRKTDL
jgi:hypothetical protein